MRPILPADQSDAVIQPGDAAKAAGIGRCRRAHHPYFIAGATVFFAALGAMVNVFFPLIPLMGWASIAVFLAIVFPAALIGMQTLIVKNHSVAGLAGWLLLTVVMGYFIAPMVGLVFFGAYRDEASLVMMLGIGGLAVILTGTAGIIGLLARFDVFELSPRPRGRRGMFIFAGSLVLSFASDAGITLGAAYPPTISMGWPGSAMVCVAALLGLATIKNHYRGIGLAWLLLFIFMAGYSLAPLLDQEAHHGLGLFIDVGFDVMMAIFFGFFLFNFGFNTPDAAPVYSYGKVDMVGIGGLAILLSLIGNLLFY